MPYIPNGSLQFNHETGFHGVVKIGTTPAVSGGLSPSLATILATQGSIEVAHEPIFSSGVWGSGWYNAASQVAYANNVIKMSGTVGYELIVGDVFNAIQSFGFENRAASYGHTFVILPDGFNGYTGPGWCSQVDISANEDALVSGSIGYSGAILNRVSDDIGNNWLTSTNGSEADRRIGVGWHPGIISGATPGKAATGGEFNGVFPFWATGVYRGATGTVTDDQLVKNVSEWNASYSSQLEFMTLCSGYTDFNGPITPDYIMVGAMEGSGSMTIIGLSSEVNLDNIYDMTALTMVVRPNNGLQDQTKWGKILLPSIVKSSIGTSTQQGGALVTAEIQFTAIGDGSKPPVAFMKYQ